MDFTGDLRGLALSCLLLFGVFLPAFANAGNATCFDFIVVGGGTAGTAVATRSSQYLPDDSILVVEAGPFAPFEDKINIPGMKGSTLGTKYDWDFTSVPQAALFNRTITQSRGKVLGGTSALNLLIWDRGSKPEYDAWGQVGNSGWNWESMNAAMNKAEKFSNPGLPDYSTDTGYGTAGPINAVVNKFIPRQQDPRIPTAIDPGHYNRSYSAVEYLPRAGPNLRVMTNTQVAKINLESRRGGYVATGVTLLNGQVLEARKDVILPAGTISNPPLLEMSGIGNGTILEAAGIKPRIDLPGIGECQNDGGYGRHGEISEYDYCASAYSYQGRPSMLEANASAELINTAKAVVADTANNLVDAKKKLEYLANSTLVTSIAQAEYVLSDGYTGGKGYPAKNTTLYGTGFTTIIAGLMHELARGSAHLNTTNTTARPFYDPDFASNAHDLQALIAMAKYIRRIATTAPFSEVWVDEYEPGSEVQSDAQWETFVRNNTNTFYHPVGTCAMLLRQETGVVDPMLLVLWDDEFEGGGC
ncbi:hypothetical protein LTR62_002652 [Meristemomyces frigidus]|uniref:Glucose-methanol-choline oxidoreductase N-terminal domain-containing protein n=1 Tax=Meristemomyces frigidus TaxID=1508187 RepID=A0AAN7YHD8_9PEZI|nr:hypothetical protein LTR62_002652 [Meristemomyces frigidus]